VAGGVGGAKLANGLSQILQPDELTVIVNTGDDFTHLGLRVSPDLDTVCYTLAGLANLETGWGRSAETWQALENLTRLGGPNWFQIGDQDLGTHLERTRRLANGDRLSMITRDFCTAWGIKHSVLPMTDDSVATWVETVEHGWLPFQEYFVREQCKPRVKSFRFEGIENAHPAPGVQEAIESADWVMVCPSNPWVSIGPILGITPLAALIRSKPVLVISPIIGGKALKGPAAKMYQELGIEPSPLAVAVHYQEVMGRQEEAGKRDEVKQVIFIDTADQEFEDKIRERGIEVVVTDIIMKSIKDRQRLASETLAFCAQLDRGDPKL